MEEWSVDKAVKAAGCFDPHSWDEKFYIQILIRKLRKILLGHINILKVLDKRNKLLSINLPQMLRKETSIFRNTNKWEDYSYNLRNAVIMNCPGFEPIIKQAKKTKTWDRQRQTSYTSTKMAAFNSNHIENSVSAYALYSTKTLHSK